MPGCYFEQIREVAPYKTAALSGKFQKLEGQLPYLGSSISSTESNVNLHTVKAWIATDWLLIIYKPDFTHKIKQDFFQAEAVSVLLYGCTTLTLTKHKDKIN